MNESGQNTKLVAQEHVGEDGEKWHRAAFEEIGERLADPGFPCVFSRNAFRKQLVKFIFVEDRTEAGIRHLAEGLKEYVGISKEWDGRLDTAYPLIAVFSPDTVDARTVEEYHAFGWEILQELHRIDPAPWPEEVGRDPGSESWSMCFDGMPLFCNMSCPAHRVRRSRNLGENFALVINPRERFDVFAGDTPSGRRVRSNIRSRIHRYDGVPHSPYLGSYGTGALEWFQYGLAEEDTGRTDECPFTFRGTAETRKES